MPRGTGKLAELRDLATLVRWLGPWANDAVPTGVARTSPTIGGVDRAYLYAPIHRAPAGAYVVAHGLHFLGPDDPRLDRFCRVLAASGILVLAPFLPDFLSLRIGRRGADHLAASWDHLAPIALRHGIAAPALFSISFGSAPAIELAARESHRDRVGALVVFGGFGDFGATIRFAITGVAEHQGKRLSLTRDPLNSPAVFINLLPHLDARGDPDALAAAWRAMVERTWGRAELKTNGARDPIADAIAATLPEAQRELFLIGCGLRPGAGDALEAGLAAAGASFDFFDPRPHLPRVRAPVFILHGRDDDVIPWSESEKIRRALPAGHRLRVHVTGMASHTGVALPRPVDLARELATMLATAQAIVSAPR